MLRGMFWITGGGAGGPCPTPPGTPRLERLHHCTVGCPPPPACFARYCWGWVADVGMEHIHADRDRDPGGKGGSRTKKKVCVPKIDL